MISVIGFHGEMDKRTSLIVRNISDEEKEFL
jgi:hypothetical protein